MSAHLIPVTILLILFEVGPSLSATNYCNSTLCWSSGQVHVACNNTGRFGPACLNNPRAIALTDDLRTFLLAKHNTLRNNIARGAVSGFSPATRMAPVRWSPQLAAVAQYGVRRCQLTRDECRNTEQFPLVGQNVIRSQWGTPNNPTVRSIANKQIQAWFNQNQYATQANIDSFQSSVNGNSIAQFAQIVNQRVTHIGCAIMRQTTANRLTQQLMICNYAFINQNNRPVYTRATGAGGQGCETGNHATYKFLCSFNEVY